MEAVKEHKTIEARPGYKKTKLGWIPEEWNLVPLIEVCNKFINGGTPSTKIADYWEGNIPWITGADIINQEINEVRRFITNEAVQNSATNVIKKGNLLIVTRTGVGKLTIAPYDIAISQDLTGVYCKAEKLNTLFLFYYLDYSISYLARLNQGTSINGITRDTLIKYLIKLPPLQEQHKIATILSTWDKTIDRIRHLIEKKQQLKKGLAQQLLTGKKRLPGFSGEWERIALGDIAAIRGRIGWKGLKQSEYIEDGPYLIASKHIQDGRIIWDTCDHITIERYNESFEIALKEGDVIFSKDGALGNPALIDYLPGEATINSTMMLVRPENNKLDSSYLFSCLQSFLFDKLVREKVSGGAIPHIFQRDMKSFQIPLPDRAEQQKIEAVLSACDKEIQLLKQKLATLKQQKKGLMHKLLTGEVRVKID